MPDTPRTSALVPSALALLALHATVRAAQTDEGPRLRVEGPPAPVAPAVISRDGDGNATMRATRRDTDDFDRFSAPSNRDLTIKVNRLLRL